MLKKATHYRDDVWLGRYFGHPLTAITHLGAGIGMVALLAAKPEMHYGGWGWLFALVPGFWLFMLGVSFSLWMTAKLLGMAADGTMLSRKENTWRAQLCSREALAFVVLALLGGFTLHHNVQANWSRPFDQPDYARCVGLLDLKGQAYLADNAEEGMPRQKFWQVCRAAETHNSPKPQSFALLKKTVQH